MGRILLKSRSDIISNLIDAVIARTDLTDVNDASVIRHILTSVGAEMFDIYGQFTNLASLFDFQTAEASDLDARAKEILGGTLLRNGAARAIGSLIFNRTVAGVIVNIPTGTICLDGEGTKFKTTSPGIILAPALTSGPVPAVAVSVGLSGNTPGGTVTSFATKPPGANTVTNDPFAGGLDRESDASFRVRIYNFTQSLARSPVDGLESALLGVTDSGTGKSVQYVHIYEPPLSPSTVTAFIDDGSGTADLGAVTTVVGETLLNPALGGEEFLYTANKPLLDNLQSGASFTVYKNGVALVLGGTGATGFLVNWASGRVFFTSALVVGDGITADYQYYTGLMAEAQRVVDGDPLNRVAYPGYRAAGIDVRVLVPTVLSIPIVALISLQEGYDKLTVSTQVSSNVVEYINGLGISGDVVRAEIIERIMTTPGVYNVNLSTPASDRVVSDDQIARTTTAQVTIL